MTPEQKRIAIAEACGWQRHKLYTDEWPAWVPKGFDYIKSPVSLIKFEEKSGYKNGLPNYLNDLNAMHEAEKTLKEQIYNYTLWLIKILNWSAKKEAMFVLIHATASQRADAFLLTIGKEI